MDATLTVTKKELELALLRWERKFRGGETRTVEETASLPLDQVASESADYLWLELSGLPPP